MQDGAVLEIYEYPRFILELWVAGINSSMEITQEDDEMAVCTGIRVGAGSHHIAFGSTCLAA